MSTRPNHLLIDGDIIAFVSAAAAQQTFRDVGGWHMPIANEIHGEAILENMLHGLKVGLKADTFEIYLSDTESNWRFLVDPTYKQRDRNAALGARPLLLTFLKQYLREKHGATHWAGLEADDVLSILATQPDEHSGEAHGGAPEANSRLLHAAGRHDGGGRVGASPPVSMGLPRRNVLVGRDKDFKSIPASHHAWKQDIDANGNMLIREVTRWEADRFHLIQALAGDRVDGFAGCPGIGMDRAAVIIDTPTRLVPQAGVKTRGVNKGEAVTRWMSEPTQDLWECIVTHYQKGMSNGGVPCQRRAAEDGALVTARLARLLRHGEYDRATERVTLWTPALIMEHRA